MRLISHWLRRSATPQLTLTVASALRGSLRSGVGVDQWSACFAEMDSRQLPATWASALPVGSVTLAAELIASEVDHELAMRLGVDKIDESLGPLQQRASVLKSAGLNARTLVCETSSVHPGVMTRLMAHALVPTSADARVSRTGALRAMAWNQWETPLTDRCTTSPSAHRVNQLTTRLTEAVKYNLGMHVLCMLEGSPSSGLLRFLDHVAQYKHRGWIAVKTAGQLAEAASLRVGGTADHDCRQIRRAA